MTPALRACALWLLISLAGCAARSDPPEELFARFDALVASKDYRQALNLAEETLKRYPRSGRLKLYLGRAAFLKGDFERAAQRLSEALNAGWGGVEERRILGSSHLFLGNLEQASGFLETAMAMDPADTEGLKGLAYTRFYQGRGRQAAELLERAVQTDPQDLEAKTALDAVMGLTGRWSAAQMAWHTDQGSGMQIAYPGGWSRQDKSFPGPAGKVAYQIFSGSVPGGEGRYRFGQFLMLTTIHNAGAHPLPWLFKGSPVTGEISTKTFSRDPKRLAPLMSREVLLWVLDQFRLTAGSFSVNAWTARRGQATYCLGRVSGEDSYGNDFDGFALGVYDPFSDTFGSLLLVGPRSARHTVEPLSRAIFNLALFGGIAGVPPAPAGSVSAEEYQARIEAFLQSETWGRALTEAQEAVKQYPQQAILHFLAGEAQRKMGQWTQALEAYQRASGLGLSTLTSELALGDTALALGDWPLAQKAYGRVLRIKPSDPGALVGIGIGLLRQGNLEEAGHYFERARVEAPHLEVVRYYGEIAKAQQGQAAGLVQWFRPRGRPRDGFAAPGPWALYELDEEGAAYRVLFSPEAIDPASPQTGEGLIYLRQERAMSQAGRTKESQDPEKVAEDFILDQFERLTDPQKVLQFVGLTQKRGSDRWVAGQIGFTQAAKRWTMRIFCLYQPARDCLHVLILRTGGTSLGPWEPFAQACFETAVFE
ncbi:MAG: tetratricopeptide repeat protein [Candidatus Omnitrophica bacterium]|nr:tetratricopeptide repeat protein [Candidatus Omnitrophota bacterium]